MSSRNSWWYGPRKISIVVESDGWIMPHAEELARWIRIKNDQVCINTNLEAIFEGGILFLLGYTQLVSDDVLDQNYYNLVVHESDLPKGKGFAPMSWQILNNKNIIPVSLFNAISTVDAGDILIKDQIELSGFELCDEIRKKQGDMTIKLCKQFLNSPHPPKGIKQHGESTFYRRRTEQDSRIDIDKSLREQFNLLRIVDNKRYPAFFDMGDHRYEIQIKRVK